LVNSENLFNFLKEGPGSIKRTGLPALLKKKKKFDPKFCITSADNFFLLNEKQSAEHIERRLARKGRLFSFLSLQTPFIFSSISPFIFSFEKERQSYQLSSSSEYIFYLLLFS